MRILKMAAKVLNIEMSAVTLGGDTSSKCDKALRITCQAYQDSRRQAVFAIT